MEQGLRSGAAGCFSGAEVRTTAVISGLGTAEIHGNILMKTLNVQVKHKRRCKATTDSQHNLPLAANVLDRQFSPATPNQAWDMNMTYL